MIYKTNKKEEKYEYDITIFIIIIIIVTIYKKYYNIHNPKY
jgi:heme/copper-type cytochrome/quinol oxidase subunit 4